MVSIVLLYSLAPVLFANLNELVISVSGRVELPVYSN